MKAYMYKGALLCETCALKVMDTLTEDTGDSEDYPQGPYADGGGEADTPQVCDICFRPLNNPLTEEGRNREQET